MLLNERRVNALERLATATERIATKLESESHGPATPSFEVEVRQPPIEVPEDIAASAAMWVLGKLEDEYKRHGAAWDVCKVAGWHATCEYVRQLADVTAGANLEALYELVRRIYAAKKWEEQPLMDAVVLLVGRAEPSDVDVEDAGVLLQDFILEAAGR